MTRKLLPVFGIAYAMLSIVADIVAAMRYQGYSYADQAVSELSAIGSPTRGAMQIIFLANVSLLTAFGWTVWLQAAASPALRRTGALLITLGLSDLVWVVFPMHTHGQPTTWTDTGHLVVTALTVALMIAVIWTASRTQTPWFRRYSMATIVVLLLAGSGTSFYAPRVAANLATPWMGLIERSNYYGFMLWVIVFAITLHAGPFSELIMGFPSRRFWVRTGVLTVAGFIAIQFVPYGREHLNPPLGAEPAWDSPETRALAKRACFDCHSNETEWPAYSKVAPISWVIHHDVSEGRKALNFSEWQRPQKEAEEAGEEVLEGEMPLRMYQLMHSHARMSAEDRERLARGLDRTLGRLVAGLPVR